MPPNTQAPANTKTLNQPRSGLSTIQAELKVQVDPDTDTATAAPTAIHPPTSVPVTAHITDPTMSGRPNNSSGGVR